MINLVRTDSENVDFRTLVSFLDKDLAIRDGDDHAFFAQFNKIDAIRYVVIAYDKSVAIGCGAIKEYSPSITEVKRMYVMPGKRGQGIGSLILNKLEAWAYELGYDKCILETGEKQPEAIQLYKKNQYAQIPNYGQYTDVTTSVCFEKCLKP